LFQSDVGLESFLSPNHLLSKYWKVFFLPLEQHYIPGL
jgi:hypothetical protein